MSASEPAVVLCPDGHDNPLGARFCSRCGVPLEPPDPHR